MERVFQHNNISGATKADVLSYVNIYEYTLLSEIPDILLPDTILTLMCSVGSIRHKWETLASNYSNGCIVCNHLKPLRRADPAIETTTPMTRLNQTHIEFRCSQGHKFAAKVSKILKQCPCCKTELAVWRSPQRGSYSPGIIKINPASVFVDDQTKLRVTCNQTFHRGDCTNEMCTAIRKGKIACENGYWRKCANVSRCVSDFYATSEQLIYHNYIMNCDRLHMGCPEKKSYVTKVVSVGPVKILRLLECLFDTRFDDPTHMYGLRFTAISMARKIAVIHSKDKGVSSADVARVWCADKDIVFIYIQATAVQPYDETPKLSNLLVAELIKTGKIVVDPYLIEKYKDLPTCMRDRNIADTYVTKLQRMIHEWDAIKMFLPHR